MQNLLSQIPEELVNKWGRLADEDMLQETVKSLRRKQIEAYVAATREEAINLALSFIPEGAEVWDCSSTTLDQLGISAIIRDSNRYVSLRKKVFSISDPKERLAARRATATVKYTIGSVHAVSKDGVIMVASMTGSQLPYYAYTTENVILVVGTQKIVQSIEEGLKRIEEYCVPLEELRVKSEGGTGTALNKILIIKGEHIPGRIKVVFVKERVGF